MVGGFIFIFQIRNRLKTLKNMYKEMSKKAEACQDGSFDPTREMMFYKEVGEILSRRIPDEWEVYEANQASEVSAVKQLSSNGNHAFSCLICTDDSKKNTPFS